MVNVTDLASRKGNGLIESEIKKVPDGFSRVLGYLEKACQSCLVALSILFRLTAFGYVEYRNQ